MPKPSSFRHFKTSPDVSQATVRFWWNRFGPQFAADFRQSRADRMRPRTHLQRHLDAAFVKINGEMHSL